MDSEKKPHAPWWQSGVNLFLKLSGWIAGPPIVGVLLGKWLDRKYHTEPWLLLLSVGIAFIVSMVVLVRTGFKEFDRINKESEKIK